MNNFYFYLYIISRVSVSDIYYVNQVSLFTLHVYLLDECTINIISIYFNILFYLFSVFYLDDILLYTILSNQCSQCAFDQLFSLLTKRTHFTELYYSHCAMHAVLDTRRKSDERQHRRKGHLYR